MQEIKETINLPNGQVVEISTGKLAKQADGSVIVKCGDMMLLATAVSKNEPTPDADFMPLTVEYQEKYAAAGRFPGGFLKRESRPSEYEILIARLVDRALRPIFPENYHAETQVLVYLISADPNYPPDAFAALAASAALTISDIPFDQPISEVRVAKINGEFKINPSIDEIESADLDLMVGGTLTDINMVEGESKEVDENTIIEALKIAHEYIKLEIEGQMRLREKAGKPKRIYDHEVNSEEIKQKLEDFCYDKVLSVAREHLTSKKERQEKFDAIKEEFLNQFSEDEKAEITSMVNRYFHDLHKRAVRQMILEDGKRLDGRALDEIRPIWCEVNYLPSAHGSAIFTRGETQSLTTVTLGTKLDEQLIDGAVYEGTSNFLLHYNFPPFSTGEVKPLRLGRREIGHGNLALRALKNMIVRNEDNPYTIRVVSDILESNGSSSMATVCAGSLALMDSGVKMSKPVSGIAMGLIMDETTGKYAVLSDILGDEDHLGDMDFKVAGTADGITACQMDIKVKGLSFQVLSEALLQAKKGRLHILNIMNQTISTSRPDYKPNVPRYKKLTIPREFMGAVIGVGGKVIQELQRETNSTIVIEEAGDMAVVDIFSTNKEGLEKAVNKIKAITTVPQIGDVFDGIVKSIQAYGAFVEILPGKEGLLHISEIDNKRVNDVNDYYKVGDHVQVKILDIDTKTGKFKLSHKALIKNQDNNSNKEK
ncbi:MAG: Polyribonucleotide nucleotidyltransferase [Bacteroidetes bacterium ADurb.Bin035]|jgi:polyribonucleotide nucleotidyltransferase|nr:polyribonucleotide nucleotidyltransferase [Bacteroidales bacterium]OQC45207.1 MAG: Polyribonucleotide nucleotidyltransferase [Bacteroidetes bacterium ADurb.Bin035]HNY76347.1 polyribonucleotide nucleotidyltransferase [Bacteroidales bacterium]HOC41021.1 polyribonucleotide nucleotidyltransferase [Bacteroidales bacterium]HOF07977.1 polyribonucleotide nucleotidyltransferase [Bacteroidales bacterium]